MKEIRAALYARVSSEQQASAHTVEVNLPLYLNGLGPTEYPFHWNDSLSTMDTAVPP
jgi:hypothetical protein